MSIFGSYVTRDRKLTGEAVNVALLDALVAIMAGLIIFPACFAYGINPDAGPGLVFLTLTNDADRGGGRPAEKCRSAA